MNRVHGDCTDQGNSFNFANLESNLPMSAFNTAVNNDGCIIPPQFSGKFPQWDRGDWVNGQTLDYSEPCNTIIDWAYFPTLVVPTQIRDIDPAWATCAVALDGLYDPPKALTAQTTADGPSLAPTTAASPASTATNASPEPTSAPLSSQPSSVADPSQESRPTSTAQGQEPTSLESQDQTSPEPQASAGQASTSPADNDPTSPQASVAPANSNAGVQQTTAIPNPVISILTNALSSSSTDGAAAAATESEDSGGSGNSANDPGSAQPQSVGLGASAQPTTRDPGGAIVSAIAGGDPTSSLLGSDPSSGSGSSDGSRPANSIIVVGSSTFGVAPAGASSAVVISGGGSSITLAAGQTSSIGGQAVSAPPSGGAVIGTGSGAVTVAPASQTPNDADPGSSVLSVSSSAFTLAVTQVGYSSAVVVANGGTTATLALGATTTLGGQIISIPSSGGAVIGTGSGATSVDSLPGSQSSDASTSGAVLTLGSSGTLGAVRTVVTGADGQATTEVIVGGSTIAQGSSAIVSGHIISIGSSAVVVDGTGTQQISALQATSGRQTQAISGLPTAPAANVALLSLGSSIATASEFVLNGSNEQLTTEAVIDGETLTAGGSPMVISSHTVSLAADGVIIDGTLTATLSALDPAVTGAVLALGSSSLTAGETVVRGSDGKLTTEVIVDGSTIIENGAPITLDGHTLSFGPSGVVVDGTRTDPLSLITPAPSLRPETLVENGQTYNATPVPGSPGVYVVNGRTLSVGGPDVTMDGLTLTAQSSDLVVDGTDTVSFAPGASRPSSGLPAPGLSTTLSGGPPVVSLSWPWWSVFGLSAALFSLVI